MKSILVLCTGNSCRSQMAHGFLKKYLPEWRVESAGIEAHGLNPLAVKVMSEIEIDISHHSSTLIEEFRDQSFDFVLTVCDNAKENCPFFPAQTKVLHQNFKDPSTVKGEEKAVLPSYRICRDEISTYCKKLAAELD